MSKIRKLGFVIPTLGVGGAERVVACLARALAPDFQTVIFVQSGAKPHYEVDSDIVEIPMTLDGLLHAVEVHGVDLLSDHFHWDIEHVKIAAEVADAGVPIILTEHNSYYYPLFYKTRHKNIAFGDWFHDRYQYYSRFAGVTVLNQDTFNNFSRHLDNVCVVPNPIPYEPTASPDYRAKRLLTSSHFLKRAKRIDLLYAVQSQLQNKCPAAELVILGNYSWLHDQYFRKASGVHPAAIKCPGRTRFVEQYYDTSSLFAMTSEIEGQPMVLLEAAMHALPQICFDIPGLSDQIIDGVTGHLIPFGDVEAFADRAAEMLGSPDGLARMGADARAFVQETFSVAKVTEIWKGLISEIEAHGRIKSSKATLTKKIRRKNQAWETYWERADQNDIGPLDPKISFLVPVYGTEELLGRCLRSIQNQTLTEFECLVVDDASPGDVQSAMDAAIGNDQRFRLIRHEKNRGLYQARSTAAAQARGLYFANIDSDDYIHERFAEILFEKAVLTDSEIVECSAVELHGDGQPIQFNKIQEVTPIDGREATKALLNHSLRHVVWNKLYARDLWRRVPNHNDIDVGLSITEDLLRNSLLFPECRRYSAVTDCLYYYCRRPTSVVKGGDLNSLRKKLQDVETSYAAAKSRFALDGDIPAWQKLEARRVEDIKWYVSEYLQRHDELEVKHELAVCEVDSEIALTINLVIEIARLSKDLKLRFGAWQWELNRANRLEEFLKVNKYPIAN